MDGSRIQNFTITGSGQWKGIKEIRCVEAGPAEDGSLTLQLYERSLIADPNNGRTRWALLQLSSFDVEKLRRWLGVRA